MRTKKRVNVHHQFDDGLTNNGREGDRVQSKKATAESSGQAERTTSTGKAIHKRTSHAPIEVQRTARTTRKYRETADEEKRVDTPGIRRGCYTRNPEGHSEPGWTA